MAQSRRPGVSLYVRHLPDDVRADDLRGIFEKYGPVRDVYVPMDYYTRRPRGFCYVEYEDDRDAEDGLHALDGTRYHGCTLEVEFAMGDRKTPNQMRGKYGPPERMGRHGGGRRSPPPRSRRRSYSRSRSRSPVRRRSRSRSVKRGSDSRSIKRESGSRSIKRESRSRSPPPYKSRKRSHRSRTPKSASPGRRDRSGSPQMDGDRSD